MSESSKSVGAKQAASVGSSKQKSTVTDASSKSPLIFWEKTVEWIFVRKYFKPRLFAAPLDDVAEGAGDVLINFLDVKKWCIIEFKSGVDKISTERGKFPIYGWSKWREKSEKGSVFTDAVAAFGKLVTYWKSNQPPHFFVCGKREDEFWFAEIKKMILEMSQNPREKRQAAKLSAEVLAQDDCVSIGLVGVSYWGEWCNEGTLVSKVPAADTIDLTRLAAYGWELNEFKKYVATLLDAKALEGHDSGDGDGGGGGGWLFSSVMGMDEHGGCISFSLHEFALRFGLIPEPPQNTPPVVPPVAPPTSRPSPGRSRRR